MKPWVEIGARVGSNGKVTIDNREGFVNYAKAFAGKRIDLGIREHEKTRSQPANAYYFGIVVKMIADEIGDSVESVHEILKAEHNSEMKIVNGMEMWLPRSTSRLSTKEFTDYIERCREWAAGFLMLDIPDPMRVSV